MLYSQIHMRNKSGTQEVGGVGNLQKLISDVKVEIATSEADPIDKIGATLQ